MVNMKKGVQSVCNNLFPYSSCDLNINIDKDDQDLCTLLGGRTDLSLYLCLRLKDTS